MNDANARMLKANLKQLRLPTMLAEWEKLAREAAARNQSYDAYLLQLTELEVASRSANAIAARIRAAGFPALKDFDTFDFTATPNLAKQKVLELTRGAVDRAALQLLSARRLGDRQDAPGHCPGTGSVPARASGSSSSPPPSWSPFSKSPSGSIASTVSWPPWTALTFWPWTSWAICRSAARRRAALPGLRRPLRATQPADHQQPSVRRVGPGVPGRTHDGGIARPAHAPVPHFRDERRKLSIS